MIKVAGLLLALMPLALQASTVYSNTLTDTLQAVFYSPAPYSRIGDLITLGGIDRTATSATAEFFNTGSVAGTFDAVLRFYDVGAPVGAEIGSGFSATGISVASLNVVDVVFSNLGNVFLPDSVVFTLEVSN